MFPCEEGRKRPAGASAEHRALADEGRSGEGGHRPWQPWVCAGGWQRRAGEKEIGGLAAQSALRAATFPSRGVGRWGVKGRQRAGRQGPLLLVPKEDKAGRYGSAKKPPAPLMTPVNIHGR